MANMSYCRWENTYNDLNDCADHVNDDDLSKSEGNYRIRLIHLCKSILDEANER